MKYLLSVLLGVLGDFSFARLAIAVLAAFGLAAVIYWLALPRELPLWPGLVVVAVGAVVGLVWENSSQSSPLQRDRSKN